MKIQASTRLLAKADEVQARQYLEHYMGVPLGKKTLDKDDSIKFEFDARKYEEVRKQLAKHFSGAAILPPHLTYSAQAFYADKSYKRTIIIRSWLVNGRSAAEIELNDKDHYRSKTWQEVIQEMKREREARAQ